MKAEKNINSYRQPEMTSMGHSQVVDIHTRTTTKTSNFIMMCFSMMMTSSIREAIPH